MSRTLTSLHPPLPENRPWQGQCPPSLAQPQVCTPDSDHRFTHTDNQTGATATHHPTPSPFPALVPQCQPARAKQPSPDPVVTSLVLQTTLRSGRRPFASSSPYFSFLRKHLASPIPGKAETPTKPEPGSSRSSPAPGLAASSLPHPKSPEGVSPAGSSGQGSPQEPQQVQRSVRPAAAYIQGAQLL